MLTRVTRPLRQANPDDEHLFAYPEPGPHPEKASTEALAIRWRGPRPASRNRGCLSVRHRADRVDQGLKGSSYVIHPRQEGQMIMQSGCRSVGWHPVEEVQGAEPVAAG